MADSISNQVMISTSNRKQSRYPFEAEEHMRKQLSTIILGVISLFYFCGNAASQDMSVHHHPDTSAAMTDTETIQDWAKQQVAKSPRHREWVKVKNGNREVNSFVVYPEVSKKATAVIVIHEVFGMSDWVQELSDELAEAGYIAIAPDLLSGMRPNGGGSSEFDSNTVRQAINNLPPDQITADLNAV